MKTVAIFIFVIALVALESCAQNTQNGWQSSFRNGHNGKNGQNGRNGRNGKDGTNGVDGKDGVNGKDGINGTNGKDGKDGINGRDGINGTNGKDGTNGTNGKDGKDGREGQNSEGRNWKECAWYDKSDPRDKGVIKTCQFIKKSESTYLYAQVASTMRIYNCDNCCARWFITFDGAGCSPVPIDIIVNMLKGTGANIKNLHRPRVILGRCKIQKKGPVNVALNVGNCYGNGNVDANTGWLSATRIYVEEIEAPQ